jgi:hypothetical protein
MTQKPVAQQPMLKGAARDGLPRKHPIARSKDGLAISVALQKFLYLLRTKQLEKAKALAFQSARAAFGIGTHRVRGPAYFRVQQTGMPATCARPFANPLNGTAVARRSPDGRAREPDRVERVARDQRAARSAW